MSTSIRRCMIIVWDWSANFELRAGQSRQIPVEGEEEQQTIFILHQKVKDAVSTTFQAGDVRKQEILRLVDERGKTSSDHIFIFLHRSEFSSGNIQSLTEAIQQQDLPALIKIYPFGEVDGPIYLRPQFPYGLLGTKGHLFLGTEDSPSLDARLTVDPTTIKYRHFNMTWMFYEQQLKRRIVNIYEKTLIRLFHHQYDIVEKPTTFTEELYHLKDESTLSEKEKHDLRLYYELKSISIHKNASSGSKGISEDDKEKYRKFTGDFNTGPQNWEHTGYLINDLIELTPDEIEQYYSSSIKTRYLDLADATYDLLNEPTDKALGLLFRFRDRAVQLLRVMPEKLIW